MSSGDNENWLYLLLHGFVPEVNTEECMRVEVINDVFLKNFAENQADVLQNLGFRFFKNRRVCVSLINGHLERFELILEVLNMDSNEITKTGCGALSTGFNHSETSFGDFVTQMKNSCKASQYKEFFMRPIFNQFKKKTDFLNVFIEEIEGIMQIVQSGNDIESYEDLSLLRKY